MQRAEGPVLTLSHLVRGGELLAAYCVLTPNAALQARGAARATEERRLFPVACRVEPMVTHPAPPQTRTCAIHAYGSSGRASATRARTRLAPQSTGRLVSGLVSSMSLPWFPPVGHSARRRLPSRGSLGSQFPTFRGTMRRYDCHHALLGVLHLSLVPRYRACSSGSWCPRRARCLVEAPRQRQGFWSPGPPVRE
jgi:hypothetical protein